MNREIEFITNINAFAVLSANGCWSLNSGFPSLADEIVIRQISYSSTNDVSGQGVLLIVSPQLGVIGSITNHISFTASPGTRIQLRHPISMLEFRLHVPTNPTPTPVTSANYDVDLDMVCISMDFIKYRK